MEISLTTKIGSLLKSYPFLLDYLVAKSPKYTKLENPVLRNTVAAFASIQKAASIGGFEPNDLLTGIATEIFKKTNEDILMVNSGGRNVYDPDLQRETRIETFKKIVLRLHQGETPDDIREEFHELLLDVSPAEIGAMEQKLVAEGIPETEIKKLCDLHVELFTKGIEAAELPPLPKGHPIHTFREENALADEKAETLFKTASAIVDNFGYSAAQSGLKNGVKDLSDIVRHYERKENQLFPIMEAHGLTAPPQVMWEIHDDIRAMFKGVLAKLGTDDHAAAVEAVSELTVAVRDMIFKEERILFPMVHEVFSEQDWFKVRQGEAEIGFSWVDPGDAWMPACEDPDRGNKAVPDGIFLDAGKLTPEVINGVFKHLPVDLTFVGPDDRVAYFSQTEERIFPRSEGIIGREVSKCHPPKSVDMVESILSRFKSGERDSAEFWIRLDGKFILIRYFAVREDGKYLGCLEVSQDVTDIRALKGQQRLLDWD